MAEFDLPEAQSQKIGDTSLPLNSAEARPGELPSRTADPNRTRNRRTWLKSTLAAGAGLATFAIPSTSGAETTQVTPQPQSSLPASQLKSDQKAQPNAVTPGTSYIIFSGMDFHSLQSAFAFSWDDTTYAGIYPLNSKGIFTAKIFLPEQATITEAEFYVLHKTTTPVYLYLSMTQALGTNPLGNYFASATLTTQTSNNVQTIPLTGQLPKAVNNSLNTFYFMWQTFTATNTDLGSPPGEILYGARIGYTGGIGRFKA